jgi:hypothetical protein
MDKVELRGSLKRVTRRRAGVSSDASSRCKSGTLSFAASARRRTGAAGSGTAKQTCVRLATARVKPRSPSVLWVCVQSPAAPCPTAVSRGSRTPALPRRHHRPKSAASAGTVLPKARVGAVLRSDLAHWPRSPQPTTANRGYRPEYDVCVPGSSGHRPSRARLRLHWCGSIGCPGWRHSGSCFDRRLPAPVPGARHGHGSAARLRCDAKTRSSDTRCARVEGRAAAASKHRRCARHRRCRSGFPGGCGFGGRPPAFTAGTSGASCSHSVSVRSVSYEVRESSTLSE